MTTTTTKRHTARTAAAKTAARLRRQGFDLTTSETPYVRPGCSQCDAVCINGTACHETGCPNSRIRREGDAGPAYLRDPQPVRPAGMVGVRPRWNGSRLVEGGAA